MFDFDGTLEMPSSQISAWIWIMTHIHWQIRNHEEVLGLSTNQAVGESSSNAAVCLSESSSLDRSGNQKLWSVRNTGQARDANTMEHKYKSRINGIQPEAPKHFFFPSTLEVQYPQRSLESSIRRMKNARPNGRIFGHLDWSPSMHPHLSSPNCGTEDIFFEVWNRYVFLQCACPRYALGLFHSEDSYK